MLTIRRSLPVLSFAFALVLIGLGLASLETTTGKAAGTTQDVEKSGHQEFTPVDNTHHFMEYITLPSYQGLKAALGSEPEDRAAWKKVKNHSLVLAETSALLAHRFDEKDPEKSSQWEAISFSVYNAAKGVYQAAGKKDFDQAKKQYGAMIDNCNRCHSHFASDKNIELER